MRTMISSVIIVIAAVIGFFMGAGINQAMGGATLFATIAGFSCTIKSVTFSWLKTVSICFSGGYML